MGPPGLPADYEALEHLGSGGQADVWRVRRNADGTTCVAKLFRADSQAVLREAEALSRVAHDAIPQFRGVIHEEGGRHCLFLQDVPGVTLTEWAARERGRPDFARRAHQLVRHLAAALATVHGARLAHRDLKPDNVLVAPTFDLAPEEAAGIKLIDFGVSSDAELGSRAGTRAFFAPERLVDALGAADGKRADVFAWGLLTAWLFSGRLATGLDEAATEDELRARHGQPDAYADGLMDVPPMLRAVVKAALARSPSGRLPDGGELLQRLRASEAIATVTETHEAPQELPAEGIAAAPMVSGAAARVPAWTTFMAGAVTTIVGLVALFVVVDAPAICDQGLWPSAVRTSACRAAVGRGAYLDADRARRLHILVGLLEARGDTREALLAAAEGVGACRWSLCSNVGIPLEQSLNRLCRAQTGRTLPRDWAWAVVTARNDLTGATVRARPSTAADPVGVALHRGACVQTLNVEAVAARDAFVKVVASDEQKGFLHVDMIAPVQRYIAPLACSSSAAGASLPAPRVPE